MYTFPYSLEEADYIRFNQCHLLRSSAGRKTLRVYRVILPCLCIVFLSVLGAAFPADPAAMRILAAVFLALCVWWVVTARRHLLRSVQKNIAKLKKTGRLPYSPSGVLTFEDTSIRDCSSQGESRTPYALVERIDRNEGDVYVYFSSVQAYLLPARCFADDAARDGLLAFLREKTGLSPTEAGERHA